MFFKLGKIWSVWEIYSWRKSHSIFCWFDEALKSINEYLDNEGKNAHTGIIGFKASILAHLGKINEAKLCLEKYMSLRPEIKNLNDYERVAPTIIKDILLEGLEKAGMPKN